MFSLTTIVVAYIVSYVAYCLWLGIYTAVKGKLSQMKFEIYGYSEDMMNYRITPLDYALYALNFKFTIRFAKMFWKANKLAAVVYVAGDILFYIPNAILWFMAIPAMHFQRYIWKKKVGTTFAY